MNPPSFKLAIAVGAFLASVMGAGAQPLAIHTLAGNLAPGSTNGFGSNARFNDPAGVAADSTGNIFVADTGNGTIRKIRPDGFAGAFAGLAGNFGSSNGTGTNARFFAPQGIAIDTAGNLYVADTANATVRRISPAGIVSALAGSVTNFNSFDGAGSSAQFYQPEGLAVDPGQNVYVADSWNHTIRKISPAGVVTTVAGLARNYGGADGTNSQARFKRPAGLALDATTNLYVADSLNHTIRKITPDGTVSTIAGMAGVWGSADGTNSAARFFQPRGIVVINASNLFVMDAGNQLLRKISASGTNWVVSTVAGLAGSAGSGNGTGDAVRFYFAIGLALDGAGYLYVADAGNNLIRTTRVVPPTLQFFTAGNQFITAWPTSAEGFGLETASALGAGVVWTALPGGVVVAGDNFLRTNGISGNAFYRLHQP
jgi:sugar lactone lactonase YvrE